MSEGGKKLFIRTYGCQMNVYDSQRMADALAPEGYREVNSAEEADLVLINTCHIREKASEKVFSEIGRMRQLRDQKRADGSDLKIGITGCVAQAEGDEILRRAPAVDLVVGPQSYHRLPELLAGTNARKPVDIEFPEEDKFGFLPAPSRAATMARGLTSFLTIQEGCDKFCTFCVVPYTRGAEVSRPAKDILREAEGLADAGVKELTLLGQNVNAYLGPDGHGGALDLAGLLAQLARVNGIERLRYTTSHPRDMDDALIAAHRDIAELMPYLHLPVQSGSDRVLDAMNRRHSVGDYLELVTRIRAARPDIALSGDFIVGFPGESEADFEATLGLVQTVGYAAAYSFKYSPRPGTPAAEMGDQVPEEVKSERLGRLQRLILAQQDGFNDSCIGNRLPVLLEKAGRNQGQLVGRSPYLQPVHLDAEESLIGSIQQVEITGRTKNSLHGKIVTDSAHNSDSIEELTGPPPVVRSFAV